MKFADNWLAPNPGSDAAIAQAMTHVFYKSIMFNQPNERFINLKYPDMPFSSCSNEDKMDIKG